VLRPIRWMLPLALVASHALAGSNDPLEYVDDQTGATVNTVNRPLIFAHKRSEVINGPRDYVTFAVASVDRSGRYTYWVLAYFWSVGVADHSDQPAPACRPLALQLQDGRLDLAPVPGSAHDVGIGVAVHKPPFGAQTPCVYGADLAGLRRMAATSHPVLYTEGEGTSVQYDLFEDRLPALKEFVARLKDAA
jgi:hypothetical protein